MDDIVKAAMAKWPTVPHCHGWLALDARGDWYLRDDAVQAAGPFPQAKGSRIEHAGLRAFIARNYEADAAGRWYFQNGPQRVFVDLEAAPWVWRLQPGTGPLPQVHTGDGRPARPHAAWLDEQGRLFLHCDLGFGLVHSLDVDLAAQAVEAGHWLPQPMDFAEMPARFGYVLSPRAAGA
jgi:hypothetical protein